MKKMRIYLMGVPILTAAAFGQGTKSSAAKAPEAPPTIAATVERQINTIEKEVVEAAEAMPEDKFNFSPESLNIPGSDYKGVRTFAMEVKHIATSNFAFWTP